MSEDALTRLYRACRPDESLPAGDHRYAECDQARGTDGRIAPDLARTLRRADIGKPEHKLFAGHRGIGKSTELQRLRDLLQGGSTPFLVIYLDVTRELDIADLKLADVLVLVAGQVQQELRARQVPGFGSRTTHFQNVWTAVSSSLGASISLEDVGVPDNPFLALSAKIKAAPSSRKSLREAIELQRAGLLNALNDLLRAANVALRSNNQSGLILIVDGLEMLPLEKQDEIFGPQCQQLASLATHTLYTVPITLLYDVRFSHVTQTFGEHPVPVPMIRTVRDEDGRALAALVEMIRLRCEAVDVDFSRLFDSDETLRHLCLTTGGHPRHLFMFLQGAIARCDDLPITRAAVDQAIRAYTDQLLREIPGDYWPWLRHFADGPLDQLPHDLPDDIRRALLNYLYVFEYRNGHPFYDVNPAIRLLKRFTAEKT